MIRVTRLNGRSFIVNAELIRTVEELSEHDTCITLVGGDKLTVQEPVDEVVRRAVAYGRQLRAFQ